MTTDEELIDRAYGLLDPLVRAGRTVDCLVEIFDATGVFFDNGAAVGFLKTEYHVVGNRPFLLTSPLSRMKRVYTPDGSVAWRLYDSDKRNIVTIELARPTDPLPVYVAALKEALVGSRVQSVSVTDGGLCLHLDDGYDAVTNGALRVRIHPERVPFTVGDVFVNRGGSDLVLCVCAQASEENENANKPVVAFKIDRDILDRKELSFNVI
jgi:hypothetical protein|nr:MAG TPA: hypothetical protein [Caudoviricetes sp.]